MSNDPPENPNSDDIVSDARKPRRPRKPRAASPPPEAPEPVPTSDDEDVAELERMEISEARQRRALLKQRPPAKWSEAQEDQPFADEPPSDPRYEATQETRTAASTGARLPVTVAAAVGAVLHAVPPLSAIAEKAGLGGTIHALLPPGAASLWLRLSLLRIEAGFEQIALGVLIVVLFVIAVAQAGRRLRIAVQMFFGAVLLNAVDWLFLGPNMLKLPALTAGEHRAILMLLIVEGALTILLWLRVRPPYRPPSTLPGRRTWE